MMDKTLKGFDILGIYKDQEASWSCGRRMYKKWRMFGAHLELQKSGRNFIFSFPLQFPDK